MGSRMSVVVGVVATCFQGSRITPTISVCFVPGVVDRHTPGDVATVTLNYSVLSMPVHGKENQRFIGSRPAPLWFGFGIVLDFASAIQSNFQHMLHQIHV
jgi:hypothetical protein